MKLKKLVVGLTASAMALTLSASLPAEWTSVLGTEVTAYAATSGFWSYEKTTETEVSITGYAGVDSEITIPSELDGFKVVEIAEGAFRNSNSIEKVTIPNTITTIGHEAFRASTITEVSIPASVVTWGTSWGESYTFADCAQLTTVTINSKEIGNYSFYNCDALTTVVCGDSTETILEYAFAESESLSRVTFGTGMKSIGASAFANDKKLATVEIKSNLEVINNEAFINCESLSQFSFGTKITTIGSRAFQNTGLTEATIPESVVTWGTNWGDNCAFEKCSKLTSVTINSKEIPNYCFNDCNALTTVICGDLTESIGKCAFYSNESLSRIKFGLGMKTIGESSFEDDKRLETVEIKSNLVTIENYAFLNCESLSRISFGTELTTIGHRAFQNTGLTEVMIPESVVTWGTSWGDNCSFEACTKLTTVKIYSKEIPNYCFYKCNALETVTCGNATETIGAYAFANSEALNKIALGSNVKSIGEAAFENDTNLVEVEVKSNFEYIYDRAFKGCKKLTDISLGKALQHIGCEAFSGTGLTEVTIPASVTTWATSWDDSYAFANCLDLKVANVGATGTLPAKTFEGSKNVNIHCIKDSGAYEYAIAYELPYTLEDAIAATDVKLNAGEFTMITGSSMQVYSILTPQNTTDKITWVSGNTEIAEISANGKVTAKKAGLTAIKVTTASGKSASATITVVDEGVAVEDVVNQKDITLAKVEGIKTFKPGDAEFGEKVYFNFCTKLIRNLDYTISCVEDADTNAVKILVQGIGEYKGTITIEKENIENFTINGITEQVYTGDAITLPIEIVTTAGMKLTAGTDYLVTYAQNTYVGTATITLEGTGHYVGRVVKEFKIVPMSIEGFTLSGIENKVYTGNEITLSLVLKNDKGWDLFADKDYTVAYTNNINAGVATVEVSGVGNYTGTLTKTFEIAPKSIESFSITPFKNQAYTGAEIKLPVELFDNANNALVVDKDYVYSYSEDCTNAGIVTVTMQGIGNYTGVLQKSYSIEPIVIDDYTVSGIVDKTYTGFAALQTVKVTNKEGKELVLDKDYTVQYYDNTNAGTATVVIAGTGNYTGKITKTFVIAPFDIRKATVTLSPSSFVYDGTAKMPTVSVKNGNVILVSNKDFKVTYAQNAVVGTAKVTISGVGNYTGTVQKTFKIVLGKVAGLKQSGSKSSASATLTWTAVPGASGYEIYRATSKNSTYKKVKDQSAVTFRNTGLTGGSRYYYKVRAYKTVNGTKVYGAYSNVISAMTLPKTPKLKLEASASAITVKWDKISGCKGYELYMSTSKNGTYTRIKNANASTVSYKKSGLSSGKTYYFKVRSYITDASGKKVYSNYSTVVSGMRLPKAPSIRLTTSGKSVKVSWSKATGCKGYELYMSTSKNGTYSRIKSGNVTSYTKTGLVSGKTYYFKLRSYTKNAAGKNIYSSYGAVKSIKVK